MKTESCFLFVLAVLLAVQNPILAQNSADSYLNNAWDTSQQSTGSGQYQQPYQQGQGQYQQSQNQAQDYSPQFNQNYTQNQQPQSQMYGQQQSGQYPSNQQYQTQQYQPSQQNYGQQQSYGQQQNYGQDSSNYYGQAQYSTTNNSTPQDSYVDLNQQNAAGTSGSTSSATDYQNSGSGSGGGHPKLKSAMGGLAKVLGTGASVAAPIAGMYMMNKMMQKSYGSNPYGYGMGGMPYGGSAYGMPYGGGYGMMPGYGGYGGMMPGYGMGGMPYGGYGVGNSIMNLGLQGLRGY